MSRHPSSKPVRDAAPEWVTMLPREAEKKVAELAKQGVSPARIGIVLRDSHGVPSIHELTGKKVGQILADAKVTVKVPHDLRNLINRAINLQEHLQKNRNDLHNRRGLELIEARIRKLAKYYQQRDSLPADWKYSRASARLLVD